MLYYTTSIFVWAMPDANGYMCLYLYLRSKNLEIYARNWVKNIGFIGPTLAVFGVRYFDGGYLLFDNEGTGGGS